MADTKKDASAEGNAPPKKKGKLLIIIGAIVLMLILAVVAAFLLLSKPAADEEEEDGPPAKAAKAPKKKEPAGPPAFARLDPFVVKLQSDHQETYVQAVPELKLIEAPLAEQVKQFMPEIRHKVLLILASKQGTELSTPQGMQALANEIREAINASLTGQKVDPAKEKLDTNEEGPVTAVFFSSLIVQ